MKDWKAIAKRRGKKIFELAIHIAKLNEERAWLRKAYSKLKRENE